MRNRGSGVGGVHGAALAAGSGRNDEERSEDVRVNETEEESEEPDDDSKDDVDVSQAGRQTNPKGAVGARGIRLSSSAAHVNIIRTVVIRV